VLAVAHYRLTVWGIENSVSRYKLRDERLTRFELSHQELTLGMDPFYKITGDM
jgi:hypothetical protein